MFYQIVSVHSANVLATMVTYDCKALGPNDAPVIRMLKPMPAPPAMPREGAWEGPRKQLQTACYVPTNDKHPMIHLAAVSRKSLIYLGILAPAVGIEPATN